MKTKIVELLILQFAIISYFPFNEFLYNEFLYNENSVKGHANVNNNLRLS